MLKSLHIGSNQFKLFFNLFKIGTVTQNHLKSQEIPLQSYEISEIHVTLLQSSLKSLQNRRNSFKILELKKFLRLKFTRIPE